MALNYLQRIAVAGGRTAPPAKPPRPAPVPTPDAPLAAQPWWPQQASPAAPDASRAFVEPARTRARLEPAAGTEARVQARDEAAKPAPLESGEADRNAAGAALSDSESPAVQATDPAPESLAAMPVIRIQDQTHSAAESPAVHAGGPVIRAPRGLRPRAAMMPLEIPTRPAPDPSSPAVARPVAEHAPARPSPEEQQGLLIGSASIGSEGLAAAAEISPRPPEAGPARPPRAAPRDGTELPAAPDASRASGPGSRPHAAGLIDAPAAPVSSGPWPAEFAPKSHAAFSMPEALPASARGESRITIGRVDVQVNNHVLQAAPAVQRVSATATAAAATSSSLEAYYLGRFALRP